MAAGVAFIAATAAFCFATLFAANAAAVEDVATLVKSPSDGGSAPPGGVVISPLDGVGDDGVDAGGVGDDGALPSFILL